MLHTRTLSLHYVTLHTYSFINKVDRRNLDNKWTDDVQNRWNSK